MLNIDVLTLGNEFKDTDGRVFKVVGNLSENDKIIVELKVVKNEELEELIKE